jgi:4,5-DOPA dioxygenase extradiol
MTSSAAISAESKRAPVLFVSHGAPTAVRDERKRALWGDWGATLAKPRAVLVVSAHWRAGMATLGTLGRRALLYDFHGFPDELYRIQYDAPGAPELAREVEALLKEHVDVTRDPARPLDYGVWVPLVHLFPSADVPVLQVSLPSRTGADVVAEVGRRLGPLAKDGVLLVGSGGMTHNLSRLDAGATDVPRWASEFETWAMERCERGDVDSLVDFRARAPASTLAHPTDEHYLPLVFAAAAGEGRAARSKVEGFEFGGSSERALEWA